MTIVFKAHFCGAFTTLACMHMCVHTHAHTHTHTHTHTRTHANMLTCVCSSSIDNRPDEAIQAARSVSPARVSVIATTDMGSCNQLSRERFYRDLSHRGLLINSTILTDTYYTKLKSKMFERQTFAVLLINFLLKRN